MKKSILKVTAFVCLLWAIISLSGCRSSYDVDAKIELGYDGVVKISEGNPIKVQLNNMGDNINGEIQVEVNLNGSESVIYTKPFEIAANAEKNIEMFIPIFTIQKTFEVKIKSGNKEIITEKISPRDYISPEEPVLAVISDQPDSYRFFNNLELPKYNIDDYFASSYSRSYSMAQVTTVASDIYDGAMEEVNNIHVLYFDSFKDFKEQSNFDYMDYIYIGKTAQLNLDAEVEAYLKAWMKSGNTLFIEAGQDYKKIMSQIPISLQNATISDMKKINMPSYFYEDVSIPVLSAKANDTYTSEPIIMDESTVGIGSDIGSGHLVTLLLDMSMEPWSSQSAPLFFETMFSEVDSENYSYQEDYYYNRYRLTNIPVDKNPPYLVMLIIMIAYIAMVGPILYAIYKKRDKRDRLWIAIPATSFVCLLLLYFIGFATRYEKPIMNSISKVSYEEGSEYLSVETAIAVFNNQKDNMRIAWSDRQNIELEYEDNYYSENLASRNVVGKMEVGSERVYTSYDAPLWTPKYFHADKVLPIKQPENLRVMKMNQSDGQGFEITNPTPMDLKHAFVKFGDFMYPVGELKANETKIIDGTNAYSGSYYSFFSSVLEPQLYNSYDAEARRMQTEVDLLQDMARDEIEANRAYNNVSTSLEYILIGYNDNSIGYEVEANKKQVDAYDRNIVSIKGSVAFEKGEAVLLPYGIIAAQISENLPDYSSVYIYKDEEITGQITDVYKTEYVEYIYSIPEHVSIEDVTMEFAKVFTNESSFYQVFYEYDSKYVEEEYMEMPSIATYSVFNYETQAWDIVETDDDQLYTTVTIGEEYYKKGDIQIHVDLDLEILGDERTMIKVPRIQMKGVAE